MFWKKKEKKEESTNPFESGSQPSSPAPSYSSAPSYASQPQESRFAGANEADQRNQLMGGRDNYSERSNNRFNNTRDESSYNNNDDDEDEEVQIAGIKQQIKNVKQDSLQSTRLALQKIHETEATAANTMNMLGQQSSQIANVNRHLDMSKAYSDRASNQAEELKQLNRSIFIPVVSNPFKRKGKQELEAKQREHAEHMAERDTIRQFEYESQQRIQETARANSNQTRGERRGRSEADRRRYQFEEDSEDDAIEDEIDNNLDLLGDATSRLKNMALTMNTELDRQNDELSRTMNKVDPLSKKIVATTDKLNRTR
ncbi:hypothetical protein BD560DRAFT_408554 [Blakeslea trispora]|nr:hypothetical protein BD560DRAFT_408554 [Blakeslea trispora]